MRSKHIKLGIKLGKVLFPQTVSTYYIAFGVGLFKSLLAINCLTLLCNCSSFTSSIQRRWCFSLQYNLKTYWSFVTILKSSSCISPKTFH